MKLKHVFLGILLMQIGAVGAQEADTWEWTVAPYFWSISTGLDLYVNDQQAAGGEAEFRDLVDKVDMALMGYVELRRGRWGMYLETIYLDLSDNNSRTVGPGGPILGDLNTDAGLKLGLQDVGGVYRVSAPGAEIQFDLFAGLRHVDLEVDVLISLPGPGLREVSLETSPSGTDLMAGGRVIGKFTDKWFWNLRGDLSFGDTSGTYTALGAVGYTFGQSDLFSMSLGYRYMSIDIDGETRRGQKSTTETRLSGPVLGLVFRF